MQSCVCDGKCRPAFSCCGTQQITAEGRSRVSRQESAVVLWTVVQIKHPAQGVLSVLLL